MPRRIFQYMSEDEKRELIPRLESDLEELRRELSNDYPRVVRDAIEETIRRYTDDLEHLKGGEDE